MNRNDIRVGDIIEVTHRPGWNGLRIKVASVGTEMYPDMVHGIVTRAIDGQLAYPVGHSLKMFAARFELFERSAETIVVGDLVEVITKDWEGMRYVVEEITSMGLTRGSTTVTNRNKQKLYPVGTYVGFYPKSLKRVKRGDGKAVEKKSIFAKEGGWGP